MRWIYIITLGIVYCIEPALWLHSMEAVNHVHNKRHVLGLAFIGYYAFSIGKQYAVFCGNGKMCVSVLTFLFLLYIVVVTCLLFGQVWRRKLLFLGVFLICSISTELVSVSGVMILLHSPLQTISELGYLNVICTVESKVLLIALCRILFFSKRDSLESLLHNADILLLVVLAVLLEVPFSVVFRFADQIFRRTIDLYLYLVIQIYLMILTAYIFHVMCRYQEDIEELQCELQSKSSISRLSTQLSQLKHDLTFYTSMMFHFVQNEQYDELRTFMDGIVSEMKEVEDVFLLSDQAVSYTLSVIAKQMSEKHIEFEHIIMVSDFVIPANDFSRLLFNMLKNAMEAVEGMDTEQRKVTLEISGRQNGYHINCMNPYHRRSSFYSELFTTSKVDRHLHGKGLTIMKKIVEKHGGVMKIHMHEKLFEVDCYIPDKKRCDSI